MRAPDSLPVWLAPAKLNLFLHVTGKREDGYHTLQTLFQFLDVADQLRFELADSPVIKRIDANPAAQALNLPENDLCVNAARLLQQIAGIKKGATITLYKNLPAGGGLGGGSSDAATTLIALNQLWGINMPRNELIKLGLQLGADVPIFIHGKSAIAKGVGECFKPFSPAENGYVVLTPKISISTAEIFADPALTRDTPVKKIRGSLPPGLKNDLQPVTCRLYPQVAAALDCLNAFAKAASPARMSGSGASVFLAVDTEPDGQQIKVQCLAKLGDQYRGFVARGLNRHPHAETD